jgi:hypothetical protein
MTKADRQARYERAWRRLYRSARRFRRDVRPYWQMKPTKTPRWLRDILNYPGVYR